MTSVIDLIAELPNSFDYANNTRIPIDESYLNNIRDALVQSGGGADSRALSFAINSGYSEVVELLLENGADPNAMIGPKYSPRNMIEEAIRSGTAEMLDSLLAHGAHHIPTKSTDTFLRYASRMKIPDPSFEGHVADAPRIGDTAKIAVLLKYGASVNETIDDDLSPTALYAAAFHRNANVAELLINEGADIEMKSKSGDFTPLLTAATSGDAATVKVFVDAGANIHATTSPGWGGRTALHVTPSSCHDTIKLLVEAGVDINSLDVTDQTPLDLVMQDNPLEIDNIGKAAHDKAQKEDIENLRSLGAKTASELSLLPPVHQDTLPATTMNNNLTEYGHGASRAGNN